MSTASVWDDPSMTSGNFVKWTEPGDSVSGDLIDVSKGVDINGGACPQLVIRTDDGEDRTVTAAQAQLKSKLAEKRPEVGDRIKIAYTGNEKREGGKTLKLFTVDVKTGGAKGTVATEVDSAEDPF